MLESKFEKECVEQLKTLPNSYWPPKADALTVRGLPDRVGCVCGFYVALEFKRSEKDARAKTGRIVLQKKTLRDIYGAMGYSFIVFPENWEFVFNTIKTLAALNRGKNGKIRDAVLRGRKRASKEALI